MAQSFFDEYLVAIKPSFDINEWGKVADKVSNAMGSPLQKISDKYKNQIEQYNQQKEKIQELTQKKSSILERLQSSDLSEEEKVSLTSESYGIDEELSKLTEDFKQNDTAINKLGSNVSTASGYLQAFAAAVDLAKQAALQYAETATEVSNRFISQSSMFVDTGTRDIMGKFGVDSETAQALTDVSDVLDIDFSDYAKLTQGQRKAFDDLMTHYQEGLDKISPENLDRFNEATQKYQYLQAKFEIDMKLALMDLFSSSEAASAVLDTLGQGMDAITKLLSSDAVKGGFDLIMGVINGILKLVTTPLNWLGDLFGGKGSSTTNTTTSTVNNTFNSNTQFDTNQLAVDIGLQVQKAISR